MKSLIVVAVSFCIFILPAKAQILDSTIATYAGDYAQERCYIHYDKSSYLPGETVWFKVYLMKGIFPADESKTFYVEWLDDQGKLIARNISPVVNATTNGQFDIPANYNGKFIHVKGYTKWMLNFDSAFLYDKDIQVIAKNPASPSTKTGSIAALDFFPEGGDIIAGLPNKIAFKCNDQFGRPVKMKGVVKNKAGTTVDSLRVKHDGMGYFYLTPDANEVYSAKWKDDKGADHTTSLPGIKSSGFSLQVVIEGTKRLFSIHSTPDRAKGTLYVIGTMNQHQVFKFSKDISAGPAQATIPTQDLPSGILAISVFDEKWNPMAERITYVNNNDYLFQPEMNVQHWGLNKRARNEIQLVVPDNLPANFSVAVTDAGIDTDSSDNIISHLMLMGDIKGAVYNPASYFSNVNDTTAQFLDLVMLTNGWRRYKWNDVVKGLLPKIIFPRDTAYLSLSGKLYGVLPSQLKEHPDIIMIMNQKNAKGKILVLPVEANGSFNEPSLVLFDTAHIYYRLSKGLEGASVSFMESRLPSLRYNPASANRFYNPGDTTGNTRHFQLSDESIQLMKLYEGKVLENVIVKAKTRSPMEILDEKYTSGLFSGGDAQQFDLVNDPFAVSSLNIFNYIQGKVAGLQVNTASNPPTMTWRGGSPQLFLNEVPTDANMVATMTPADIAYIKVFRPPFFGGSGNGANGGIAIYTRKGGDAKSEPGKGLSNTVVTGYTELKQFYSPNYSTFTQANEKKDLRTTLYWNPQVVTTAGKNQVLLTFYNNDVSKAFRVIIEGMSGDGRLAHIEQIME